MSSLEHPAPRPEGKDVEYTNYKFRIDDHAKNALSTDTFQIEFHGFNPAGFNRNGTGINEGYYVQKGIVHSFENKDIPIYIPTKPHGSNDAWGHTLIVVNPGPNQFVFHVQGYDYHARTPKAGFELYHFLWNKNDSTGTIENLDRDFEDKNQPAGYLMLNIPTRVTQFTRLVNGITQRTSVTGLYLSFDFWTKELWLRCIDKNTRPSDINRIKLWQLDASRDAWIRK